MSTMMPKKADTRSPEQMLLRAALKGFYDFQLLRIANGNRILINILHRLGIPPEMPEAIDEETKAQKAERKAHKEKRKEIVTEVLTRLGKLPVGDDPETVKARNKMINGNFLDLILADYKGIVDYVTTNHGKIQEAISTPVWAKGIAQSGAGIVSTLSEFELLQAYDHMLASEKKLLSPIERMVGEHPLWTEFLVNVKGCGTLMAAVIISEFDINKAKYASSFWAYMGVDCPAVYAEGPNGEPILDENGEPIILRREGRSRKEAHQEVRKYVAKDGTIKEKKGITYNPFLKTKMLGVLGPSFLKAVDRTDERDEDGKKITRPNYYAQIYYDYKFRIENSPAHADKKPAHIHKMANRYMVKMFVADLFTAWCVIAGRTVPLPTDYIQNKLQMKPHHKLSPHLIPLLEKHAPHVIRIHAELLAVA